MKKYLLFAFLVLTGTLAFAGGPQKVIAVHLRNQPFRVFCSLIYEKSGVTVFCNDTAANRIAVTLDSDSIAVFDAVKAAVEGTGLEVSEWNGNLVLLPGETLPAALPVFTQKTVLADSSGQKSLTETEERYITGRKPDVVQTILIGKKGGPMTGSKAKVLGRVLDEETGEPVFYATMYLQDIRTGAVSDINGFFSILLKPGKYNAVFEFLGYEKQKYLLDVLSDGRFTVNIHKAVIQMKEFVVHGDRQMSIKAKDPGLDKIAMKTIKELPMMMGERNILSVSETLPGIVSGGEGSSGLNVRGGSSDQNAFYINKIPVYNTSHLFGFFPAFNSDIIKDFSIFKGHVPAQYGGRLSSVFSIITRQGNRKHFTAHGGLSPITGNIVVEGPLKKDTCSVLLSARSSYSDWLLSKIKDPTIRASSAAFYDLSAGVNYDIQKTQLAVFVYHSYDHFRLSDVNDYSYSNNGASFSFSHRYTNSLRAEYALVAAGYTFSTTDKQEVSRAYEHEYSLGHYEGRADFKQVISDKHTLGFGTDILFYKLNRGTVKPYGSASLRNPVTLGNEQGLESSLYLTDVWDPLHFLNLSLGVRYSLFCPLGPGTVYTYTPGLPVDPRYINDTILYGSNKVIKWYSEPDIRAAINFETDENGSIKLAFNQMHQNLFMLNNTITISPNAQWKLADYHLSPSRSNQISLGIFRVLADRGLETSLEFYYKSTGNSPEFKDGADFLSTPLVETTVLQGNQKAYGLEFFVKRSSRKLEGWISYTYSRSIVKVDNAYSWNQINDGKSFPANFDIPHVMNVVLSYHLTRRITFASIVTYQTGKPITYPVSVYYIDGVPTLDYSSRNAYRIPDYFRTDLSLTFEGNLKRNKLLHSSLILSLYNMTGRENPYSVYFVTSNGRIRSFQYSVIGVPVFTATWIFKLGNYASE